MRNLIRATGEDQIGYYPADRLLVINEGYNPERDFETFVKSYKNADKYANDINNQSQTHYITQQINQAITLFEKNVQKRWTYMHRASYNWKIVLLKKSSIYGMA